MEAIRLKNITKRFPGVLANDHIDLSVDKGEIRAIVGENGSGKTTLMRILYGMYQPDEGEVYIWGKKMSFQSPLEAIHAGLGMVHQQFRLFPSLTVSENIVFGNEPSKMGFFDKETAIRETQELAARHGFQLDPQALIRDLPFGVRQRVEILKSLYRNAQILILDEPTAVLTPQERDELFKILRSLAEQDKTIIFITHKLNEVMSISDNAVVLRGGRVTATLRTSETSPEEISKYMVGRNVLLCVEKPPLEKGDVVLELDDITLGGLERKPVVDSVSFKVHSSEIVGIAGVAGNGQTELVEAIVGLRSVEKGRLSLEGKDITNASIAERRALSMAYIPEDRIERGLAVDARVNENLIMNYQNDEFISKNGWLNLKGVSEFASELIKNFSIRTSSQFEPTSNLSGGNQQRVVIAREFSHQARLIIAEQPTRGIDIAATEFVHQQLIKYRGEGSAILLISADLSEIMSLSDRILVMFEGRVTGEVYPEKATEEEVGLLMAGIQK